MTPTIDGRAAAANVPKTMLDNGIVTLFQAF
jgi:hypothetical protein